MTTRTRRVVRWLIVAAVGGIVATLLLLWCGLCQEVAAHHDALELAPTATPSPSDGDVVLAG